MMKVAPGELWLADIRFTDASASKIRPVLVLWLEGVDAIVAVVTASGPRTGTDVLLADWQVEGLRKPSTVRLSHLDCLEQSLLFRRLGALSAVDAGRIRAAWDAYVKPQI
jgi:mRNA interferase MazF